MLKIKTHPLPLFVFLGMGFLPQAIRKFILPGMPVEIFAFHDAQGQSIKERFSKYSGPVTCLGWSLGGKFALDLLRSYPGRIEHLFLLNQAPYWTEKSIKKEEKLLDDVSLSQYLQSFYERCFHGVPDLLHSFRQEHYPEHLRQLSKDSIRQQLNTLRHYHLENYLPFGEKVTFLHSRYDAIAPRPFMIRYCQENSLRYHILSKTKSHFPFYSQELWTYLFP